MKSASKRCRRRTAHRVIHHGIGHYFYHFFSPSTDRWLLNNGYLSLRRRLEALHSTPALRLPSPLSKILWTTDPPRLLNEAKLALEEERLLSLEDEEDGSSRWTKKRGRRTPPAPPP